MTLKLDTNKFKLVGGDASLDFVNTVSGRSSNPNKTNGRNYYDFYRADKLENYTDLIAWSVKAGLLDEKNTKRLLQIAATDERAAEKILRRAIVLRESVYRLFKSVVEGWQPEAKDLENLNRELNVARRRQKLAAAENGFAYEWINSDTALDSMLWQISESAAEMLLKGDLTRIRQCGSDVCNWLFLDTSRNRSRQWCDMKDCGNLAKVRRFRQRQQPET